MEAFALRTRQDIQLQELLLKQNKENFELETELAKAEAEEKVYSCCNEQSPLTLSSQLPTSHETRKEITVNVSQRQENITLTPAGQFQLPPHKETVEVPIRQTEKDCSPLNPDTGDWKGYKHFPSTSNGERQIIETTPRSQSQEC